MANKNQTQTTNYGASGKNTTSTGSSTSNKTSNTTSNTQGGSHTVRGAAGVVSDKTQAGFNQATQDYVQSDRVNQAYQQLNGLQKPVDYQSTYEGQLGSLYDQIMKRDPFSWNMNSDKLYQEYKDLYQKQGQQAMNQTIGTAQALSGGYGNSYAMTAGQQAYQQYLQDIDRMAPQFEEMAYKTYKAEDENLMNKYGVTSDMDARDYGKYRDQVKDYQSDRAFFSNAYRDERNFDYGQYVDNRAFWQDEYWKERNAAQVTDSSHWQNSTSTTNSTETTTSTDNTNWSSWQDPTTTTTTTYPTTTTKAASTKKSTPTTNKTTDKGPVRDYSADAQYKLGIKPNNSNGINLNALNGKEPLYVQDPNLVRPTFRDYSYQQQQNAMNGNSVADRAAQDAERVARVNPVLNDADKYLSHLDDAKGWTEYLVDMVNQGKITADEAAAVLTDRFTKEELDKVGKGVY